MNDATDIELPGAEPEVIQAEQLNDAAMWLIDHEPAACYPAALAMLRRALNLRPNQSDTWSNLGLVMWRMGRVDDAGHALRRAVDLQPTRASYHSNLGVFLVAIDANEEALHHLEEAYRLDPSNISPKWDISLLHLRTGNWEVGLASYDIRREHRGTKLYPKFKTPLWRGEDLNDKLLLVHGEQGIGDRFLFSRYLSWIKTTWPDCRIVVALYDPLVNLFWEFRHIVEFLPQGVPIPDDVDYSVYLCTLPELHGTRTDNIPPDPGLLLRRVVAAREVTKCNLPKPGIPALKIGICWTGNPEQARNADRSIPLEMLLPLTEHPRLVFYSFQCSPGNADLKFLNAQHLICDLSSEIEQQGWIGTGMALAEMDLLVSVCTSVPHLAGSLGIPTFLMLCGDPYWLWGRHGSSTPWYPTMRLFRQQTLGDWRSVIAEVSTELNKLADASFPHDSPRQSQFVGADLGHWTAGTHPRIFPAS